MAQKLYEESNIQAIADAIRGKNGLTTTYKTSEMADAISAIESGGGGETPPEDILHMTGSMEDANKKLTNWIYDVYGNQITTENITDLTSAFENSSLWNIPFEINYNNPKNDLMFNYCFRYSQLREFPVINIANTSGGIQINNLFYSMPYLRYIPDSFIKDFTITRYPSGYGGYQFGSSFSDMKSYRGDTPAFIKRMNSLGSLVQEYYYHPIYQTHYNCCVMDKATDLPIVPDSADMKSNIFQNVFFYCYRLKDIIFATHENGVPYVVNWKSQTIDLTNGVGSSQGSGSSIFLNYNSGITSDKEVKDDATYQALKDDPDWFTTKVGYSRYNHDSAVRTINSLPDTSAYLATTGGTNTIKFKGAAGSATDGGAINTLTEEEIAVAAAKGWTVTLV